MVLWVAHTQECVCWCCMQAALRNVTKQLQKETDAHALDKEQVRTHPVSQKAVHS